MGKAGRLSLIEWNFALETIERPPIYTHIALSIYFNRARNCVLSLVTTPVIASCRYTHTNATPHTNSAPSTIPSSSHNLPLSPCAFNPNARCGFISVAHQFPISATSTGLSQIFLYPSESSTIYFLDASFGSQKYCTLSTSTHFPIASNRPPRNFPIPIKPIPKIQMIRIHPA